MNLEKVIHETTKNGRTLHYRRAPGWKRPLCGIGHWIFPYDGQQDFTRLFVSFHRLSTLSRRPMTRGERGGGWPEGLSKSFAVCACHFWHKYDLGGYMICKNDMKMQYYLYSKCMSSSAAAKVVIINEHLCPRQIIRTLIPFLV